MTRSDPPVRRVARHRPHRYTDRGSTSVEMVAYTTLMLVALLIGVQAAVWGLAELACRYAASHALQATRVDGGSEQAGETDARKPTSDYSPAGANGNAPTSGFPLRGRGRLPSG